MKTKKRAVNFFRYFFLSLGGIIILYPLSILVITAFKTQKDYMMSAVKLPEKWMFSNLTTVLETSNIGQAFFNSLLIVTVSVILQIFFGALTAYALTKMNFEKSGKYTIAFLFPMIFPIQSFVIPLYLIYSSIGLLDTKSGLILIYIATGLPLVIFMLTSFMKTVPVEISESARVEGANEFTIFFRLIVPLLQPVIATITIISGLSIWNDFFMPLIMISDINKKTLPLKIYDFMGQYTSNWPLICVCILFIIIPILIVYCIMQRYIIEGVAAGAVKG